MLHLLDGLNQKQRQAATHEGHVVVLACPGSGKSTMLITKAAYLVRRGRRVMPVTFSRESAVDLLAKLQGKGIDTDDTIITGTFHALALRQLMTLDEDVTLLSEQERRSLIWSALKKTGLDRTDELSTTDAVRIIDAFKNGKQIEESHKSLMKAYQTVLKDHGALDFDHALLSAVDGMKNGTIKPFNVDDLLVDEGQDMDELQYRWIEAHIVQGAKVTLVGDDDQSIYGFRDALGYEGMTRFCTNYQAVQTVLSTNYRSHTEIIEAANHLISQNEGRFDKDMKSASGLGGSVRLHGGYKTKLDESFVVMDHINASEGTWGLLCRTNSRLSALEATLRLNGISYKRVGGQSIWGLDFISVFVSVLRSFVDVSTASLVHVFSWSGCSGAESEQLAHALLSDKKLKGFSSEKHIMKITDEYPRWRSWYENESYSMMLTPIGAWVKDVIGHLHPMKPWEKKDGNQWRYDLVTSVSNSIARMGGSLKQRLMLLSSKDDKDDESRIVISTIHGSKGLEFDNVWIVGVENLVIPHEASVGVKGRDEERRLLYVGMTRAKTQLHMSFLEKRGTSLFLMGMQEEGLLRDNLIEGTM